MIQFIKKGGSGADISEYIDGQITSGSTSKPGAIGTIQKIPNNITVNGTSLNYCFYNFSSLTEIPLIDTSNVTSMKSMFR